MKKFNSIDAFHSCTQNKIDQPSNFFVITMLTDFGNSDPYVGIMKGVVLSINHTIQIVDIHHEIPKQSVLNAAFTIPSYAYYFPKGSIHIAVVDPGVGSNRKAIVVQTEAAFYVGPDNGIFSYIFLEEKVVSIHFLENKRYQLSNISSTFHGRDIFAPTAGWLSLGTPIESFGSTCLNPVLLPISAPEFFPNFIRAKVLHIDSFGNIITNIKTSDFDFSFSSYTIKEIDVFVVKTYYDIPFNSIAILCGSNGYMEIAKNCSSAAISMNITISDSLEIFYKNGTKNNV